MKDFCTLHCGRFSGVSKQNYTGNKRYLEDMFSTVRFDEQADLLEVCGAQHVDHEPGLLIELFDTLASVLEENGNGRILLNCGNFEMCFFRKNMWKLMAMPMPEDPFDDVHYVG
ncbi:MAG: hypothetical protein ACLFOY_09885 [Desulfatibacillaceae bacterium]